MQQININELKPHPRNNEFFDEMSGEKWTEFLSSVKKRGIIEPIVITPDKMIVSGHQRVRACKELGIKRILCDVHTYDNDDDILADVLMSNADRVKDIPSEVKKIKIVGAIYEIYGRKERKLKECRDDLVKIKRREISKHHDTICQYHSNKCDICGFDFKELLQIHHILPLQQGGNNSEENLSCLCPNCHALEHKLISYYQNDSEDKVSNELTNWINDNYTLNASERIHDMYYTYIKKYHRFGWEKLTYLKYA